MKQVKFKQNKGRGTLTVSNMGIAKMQADGGRV